MEQVEGLSLAVERTKDFLQRLRECDFDTDECPLDHACDMEIPDLTLGDLRALLKAAEKVARERQPGATEQGSRS